MAMGMTQEIGQRVEIVNMDAFHEITIALYQQQAGSKPVYLVHSYSSMNGANERVEFVARGMSVLGGMDFVDNGAKKLCFSCAHAHLSAVKLLFLRSCNVDQSVAPEILPLTLFDKKSEQKLSAGSLGSGVYELTASGTDEKQIKHVQAIRDFMVKRVSMEVIDESTHRIGFSCGHSHDVLAGVLLERAKRVKYSA